MPLIHLEIPEVPRPVAEGVKRLQTELDLRTGFPPAALEQGELLSAAPPSFDHHVDRTDIHFLAIDPPASMDLDQILNIERDGAGYLVRYGIADVHAFVEPGSPIDAEAHERGQTFYAPGARLPLHPPTLSEGAASLLADGAARPVYLWSLRLDGQGQLQETALEKALVINREKLNYEGVQADIDAGRGHPTLALLKEVGVLRQAIERQRGGISLSLPDQEIVPERDTWRLEFRQPLAVENWNAQISLLTGIAAAKTMLDGKVGLLRTLPSAENWAIGRLRRAACSLGVSWPRSMSYPEFVRGLDHSDPRQLAVMVKCTMLFRGAGYLAFDGEIPDGNQEHAALATPYAHTTAPLRRLVDRYVLEICWCLLNGQGIPAWVRDNLPGLPQEMNTSNQRANAYERGVINLAEALVLRDCIGETFDAALIDVHPRTSVGTFQISDPAVEVRIPEADENALGTMFRVTVEAVDLVAGEVTMNLA